MKEDFDLCKETAAILANMVDSGLITYKYYYPWCDEIIEKEDKPPHWILELGVTTFAQNAASIINSYAYSEPFEEFDDNKLGNLFIACRLIMFLRREISWSTFLLGAGFYSDGVGYGRTKVDCEYFFNLQNILEENAYSIEVEQKQFEKVESIFKDDIEIVQYFYKFFREYRKKFTEKSR